MIAIIAKHTTRNRDRFFWSAPAERSGDGALDDVFGVRRLVDAFDNAAKILFGELSIIHFISK